MHDYKENTTYRRSYGWQHCRLSPSSILTGANEENSVNEISTNNTDADTRSIKVF